MFTSNSLFLLFTVFCWHHHFSELPQHQRFHHVTGLPLQPRSGWEPAPSAEQFPIKKPIPSHTKSCSQHQMAQEHTGDATSPCTCIASETGNQIYPKKSDFHHRQNVQEPEKSMIFAFISHWDIKDTFKWDKVLFSAEIQCCSSLLTWNIQCNLRSTPSGRKSLKPSTITTSNAWSHKFSNTGWPWS